MDAVFRQDAVTELKAQADEAQTKINDAMNAVKIAAVQFSTISDWKGEKAESVKEYIQTAHTTIPTMIDELIKDVTNKITLYQGRYALMDGDAHAVIPAAEMTALKKKLTTAQANMGALRDELSTVLTTLVQPIEEISLGSLDSVNGYADRIIETLGLLEENIPAVEAEYKKSFSELSSDIDTIEKLIAEQRGKDITAFSNKLFIESPTFRDSAKAYEQQVKFSEQNAEALEHAETAFHEIQTVLYNERKEKAETVEFVVGALTTIACVVVVVATAGTAAAVIAPIAAGAIGGGINAGVGSYMDQSVGCIGKKGEVNGFRVATDTIAGAIVGGITSTIGAASNAVVKNLAGGTGKVVLQKVLISGGVAVTNGVISDGTNGFVDSLWAGESLWTSMGKSAEAATNVQKRAGDFVGGVISQIVSEGMGTVFGKAEKALFKDNFDTAGKQLHTLTSNGKAYWVQQGYESVTNVITDVSKGVAKRFGSTLITSGGDIEEALTQAGDGKKIVEDTFNSSLSQATIVVSQTVKLNTAEKKTIERIQKAVDEKSREFNQKNADRLKEQGIETNKNGEAIYRDPEIVPGETTISMPDIEWEEYDGRKEQRDAVRYRANQRAYNQLKAEGKIDSNEYRFENGHVVHTQTGTAYTFRYTGYDVSTDTCQVQLVETDAATGPIGSEAVAAKVSAHEMGADNIPSQKDIGKAAGTATKGAASGPKITFANEAEEEENKVQPDPQMTAVPMTSQRRPTVTATAPEPVTTPVAAPDKKQ